MIKDTVPTEKLIQRFDEELKVILLEDLMTLNGNESRFLRNNPGGGQENLLVA